MFDWDYYTDYLSISDRSGSITIYKGENVIRCILGKYSFDIKLSDICYVNFVSPTILKKGFIAFYKNEDECISYMGYKAIYEVSYRDKSKGDFYYIYHALKDAGVECRCY